MFSKRTTKPALTPGNMALRLLIAAAIVGALSVISAFKPIDNLLYSVQALTAPRDASGQIAFVGLAENPIDPNSPTARKELAATLQGVLAQKPARIFVDAQVPQSNFPALDRKIATVSSHSSGKIVFIEHMFDDFDGQIRTNRLSRIIRENTLLVPNERYHDFMGYSWEAPRVLHFDNADRPAAASAIAGVSPRSKKDFYVDYRYRLTSIPTIDSSRIIDASVSRNDPAPSLRNKTVVIGYSRNTESIPGHLDVPSSLITILAAETLRAGPQIFVPGWLVIALLALTMTVAVWFDRPRVTRSVFYINVAITIALPFAAAQANLLVRMGGALIYLAAVGLILILKAYRANARKFDPRFNLPTFEALEENLGDMPLDRALVVAKVQNFDAVLAAVGPREQSEYVRRLADRFRVIDPEMTVYTAGSHFAWIARPMAREDLESHLLGLRALFSEPISVEGTPIDIGVTFGIDITSEGNPSAKIAQARSAADATNEADLPVVFAQPNTSPNRIWSLSLQHKVDTALAEGRIFPVFQPQFDGNDYRLLGVEALVRWIDEERGVISPAEFIGQCEKAGRMEAITQTVLLRSMRELCEAEIEIESLSVNVSATLLHDHRLVKMVGDTLKETGFPPTSLILEVTESWRIIDERMARGVMEEIAALGVRWSIDDFGVQSATLETLLKYPFSEVKIDRLFTQAICTSPKALALVRMICRFGREMDIDVVAEGAEDRATLRELKAIGCARIQGFVLGRPVALSNLIKQMEEREGRTANERMRTANSP